MLDENSHCILQRKQLSKYWKNEGGTKLRGYIKCAMKKKIPKPPEFGNELHNQRRNPVIVVCQKTKNAF